MEVLNLAQVIVVFVTIFIYIGFLALAAYSERKRWRKVKEARERSKVRKMANLSYINENSRKRGKG